MLMETIIFGFVLIIVVLGLGAVIFMLSQRMREMQGVGRLI